MKRWMRAMVGVTLALTLRASVPARADVPGQLPQSAAQTLPLPPPGAHRLIRIGPEALVVEDDEGRVTMADQPATQSRHGRSLIATGALFGILGFGAFLMLQGEPGVTLDLGGPNITR